MNRILGIDPGIKGGIALLSSDGLMVEKMPIITNGKKSMINLWAFEELIKTWEPDSAAIEMQHVMPGQGSVSGLTIGFNYGALIAALYMLRVSTTEIRPQKWKKELGVTADKNGARYRAIQLFPDHSVNFSRKSNDGLAEAALIAYYYKTKSVIEAA